jgi:hypothetical protein
VAIGKPHFTATHAAEDRAPSAAHEPPASKAAVARVATACNRAAWRCRATMLSPSASVAGSAAPSASIAVDPKP